MEDGLLGARDHNTLVTSALCAPVSLHLPLALTTGTRTEGCAIFCAMSSARPQSVSNICHARAALHPRDQPALLRQLDLVVRLLVIVLDDQDFREDLGSKCPWRHSRPPMQEVKDPKPSSLHPQTLNPKP